VTRFGCPRIFMSDQGTHFINNTIEEMLEEFNTRRVLLTTLEKME